MTRWLARASLAGAGLVAAAALALGGVIPLAGASLALGLLLGLPPVWARAWLHRGLTWIWALLIAAGAVWGAALLPLMVALSGMLVGHELVRFTLQRRAVDHVEPALAGEHVRSALLVGTSAALVGGVGLMIHVRLSFWPALGLSALALGGLVFVSRLMRPR